MPRKRRDPDEPIRCVCGQQEAPAGKRRGAEPFTIKCEQCGCWQHGQCVGMTSRDAPEQYWCEGCRPDLHELKTSNGKVTSKYLQSGSDSEGYEDDRDRRKRRRTMNSREDDILQRVLEQSAREEKLRLAKLKEGVEGEEAEVKPRAKETKESKEPKEEPEDDPPTPEERPKRKRKPAKRKTPAAAAPAPPPNSLSKKLKPKIPSPRASLYEMRKRVASILEFSSATQGEMVLEEAARKEFLLEQRQRGDSPLLAKIEQLYNDHRSNIGALETLTEKLLNWQERYSG